MLHILYTYKNREEFEFLKKEYDTIVCNLNQLTNNFNYEYCEYIDITFLIQHLYNNPQNKIFFHYLEKYLNEYTKAIIHENQSKLAFNMFYTIFNDIKSISDEIDELKDINYTDSSVKKILYYYNPNELNALITFFNKKNISFYPIEWAYYKEIIENFYFASKTVVDITNCFNENNNILMDYFFRIFNNYNIVFICNCDKYKDNLNFYFSEKKHIAELFTDFKHEKTISKKSLVRVIDLNNNEFENLNDIINNNLIGHVNFKKELYLRLKQFKKLNALKLNKIFSIFILGDSGLGKTEVARILNNCLNDNTNLIKINFGNYSSQDSINSLIGSPRGYRGSEAGELSIKLNKPHSGIILCDEFEKADEKIVSFFLELLEEGKFTDSQSIEYDLNGYIIIFTSNLDRNSYYNQMPNEFKSRIDLTTIFNNLSYDEKEEFVLLEIAKIKDKISENNEYSSINLDEFIFNYDLNSNNNLRNIQRELYNQIVYYIDEKLNN